MPRRPTYVGFRVKRGLVRRRAWGTHRFWLCGLAMTPIAGWQPSLSDDGLWLPSLSYSER